MGNGYEINPRLFQITDQLIAACAHVLRESGMLVPEAERQAEALAWDCLAAARAALLPAPQNNELHHEPPQNDVRAP